MLFHDNIPMFYGDIPILDSKLSQVILENHRFLIVTYSNITILTLNSACFMVKTIHRQPLRMFQDGGLGKDGGPGHASNVALEVILTAQWPESLGILNI